jgi:hypothetical protein
VIISLSEATGMVKNAFRDYTAMLINQKSPRLSLMKDSLDYDCTGYMSQLLTEIFADTGIPEVVGGTSASTKMLMDAGLERRFAAPLALQVYRVILNELINFFPDLILGRECGYSFDMCSEYDVFVTPPK